MMSCRNATAIQATAAIAAITIDDANLLRLGMGRSKN